MQLGELPTHGLNLKLSGEALLPKVVLHISRVTGSGSDSVTSKTSGSGDNCFVFVPCFWGCTGAGCVTCLQISMCFITRLVL